MMNDSDRGLSPTEVVVRLRGPEEARGVFKAALNQRFRPGSHVGPMRFSRDRWAEDERFADLEILWYETAQPLLGSEDSPVSLGAPGTDPVRVEVAGPPEAVNLITSHIRRCFRAGRTTVPEGTTDLAFEVDPSDGPEGATRV